MAKITFIVGPTGVGKSDAGFLFALKNNGEIVSADAMQVYREANISSDKPVAQMRAQVPHHMLDVVSVTEEFDVARFRSLAVAAIEDILARGKTPVVVGGSGMYITVLLDGIFESSKDETLREQLRAEMKAKGLEALRIELEKLDPEAAARIHPNDPQRTLRALEVAKSAGVPISALQKERDGLWGKHDMAIFGLNRDRDALYRRIEARIDRMFEQGLVDEVKSLIQLPLSRTGSKIIGIPEVKDHLNGLYDLAKAKYLMKLNSRHYAKRQLTWFRRDERIKWIDIGEGDSAESISEQLR